MNSTALPKDFKAWLTRPKSPPKRLKGRIKRATHKRQGALKEYTKLRRAFLGANRECQVNWRGCLGLSSEVHHRASRIGEKLNDVKDFVAICAPCHRAIHSQPSLARKLGHLK